MTYSDCDPDRPTTPESRLRDALEADEIYASKKGNL